MKALNLGKILFFILFVSCQQSEFYEKDALKNLDDFPTDLPSNGAATGDDGSSSGSATGSGSSIGNDTGSDGSANGSGTVNGGDGSATGSDGSATGSDGSATGSDGSANGSGTSNGTDGSANGSDGTANGSGTTTGDDGNQYQNVTDNFIQDQSGVKPFDILWVIDNSGSMQDNQNALAYNFEVFISQFIHKNIDFKMAITTTDSRNWMQGEIWQNSDQVLTSQHLANDQNQFVQDFQNLIKVGVNGSGTEAGIQGSASFLTKNANSFLRDDAYLVIVYVSDEEDQSPDSLANYLAHIQGYKSQAGLVKAYSIVNMSVVYNQSGMSNGYQRYDFISQGTGGQTSDINQDFYSTLTDIGENIANLSDSFPLSKKPDGDIEVWVNSVKQTTGWEYLDQTQSIRFDSNNIPSAGSTIEVRYKTLIN